MTTDAFGKKTDRGYILKDERPFRIISHTAVDLAKIKDDYAGAFKPPVPGTPHSSGLGNVPGGASVPQQTAAGTQAQRGLVIKIAATHAGLVTRNNTFYMPDKMRAGVPSWTDNYPKPIQIHHNESPGDSHDPVGRVMAARYVDTSAALGQIYQNSVLKDSFSKNVIGRADQQFWDTFNSERTSFIQKTQMIRMMDSVLNDPSYEGMGYTELTANITNPDTIQKILDGRYLTGSVGAVSDKAVCSVCDTNWVEEEHCGHRPGKIYDGVKCVVVAGNLLYDEWSFVNQPADRHSGVLEIQNSVQDSFTDGVVRFFPVFSHKEDSTSMKDNPTATVKDNLTEQPPAPEAPVVETAPVAVDTPAAIVDSTTPPAADPVVDHATVIMDKVFAGETLTDEESEKLYELQLEEMDKGVIEDAKLSTDKRKKLASSSFCSPKDRAFPVPDCAHVTAARRLIGKYKGEGSKEAILACVSRKAKALGCTSDAVEVTPVVQDNVQTQEVVTPVAEVQERDFTIATKVKGEITDSMKVDLSKTFLEQILAHFGKDSVSSAAIALGLSTDPEAIKALEDEVAKNENVIGDLRDQLSALRKELQATYNDIAIVEDKLIAQRENSTKAKVQHVALLHTIEGTFSDDVKTSLVTLTDDALDTRINTLTAKFDKEKIADRLNSGLSRTPDEAVHVPAGLTEPTAETKPTNKPSFASQKMVDEVYHRLFVVQKDPAKALAFYADMVKQGLAAPKE